MVTFLLIIIYISFISLGLPDSMAGASWPQMHLDLGVEMSMQGLISIVCSGGTIISSLFSVKAISKFGTGKVTAFSVLLTALAITAISFSKNIYLICLFSIPLGLGAGAVDSGLNNFVANHFKARHMSWLHCFWGVGVTISPLILSFVIKNGGNWRDGYLTVGVIQLVLSVILFCSLPIWSKFVESKASSDNFKALSIKQTLSIKGVKPAVLAFFCYCSLEFTVGAWGSSFLVKEYNQTVDVAASFIALYFLGITIGRGISGFITFKMNGKNMIRLGEIVLIVGVFLQAIPLLPYVLIGFLLIGLGCAPIFPSMMQETPSRFGKENSQSVMGLQMACAYVGGTFMSPIFGLLERYFSFKIMPIYLAIFAILLIFCSERVNYLQKSNQLNGQFD